MALLGTFAFSIGGWTFKKRVMAYKLTPHLDKKRGKWRLSISAKISQTGKRQRLWFDSHSLALGAANRIKLQHDQFGYSLRMLPPARLTEATEVWAMLDKAAASGSAPSGSLRSIAFKEIKARKQREKSISLNSLFDLYLEKLKRNQRSEHYIKDFKWLRGMFKEFLEEKVSDLTSKDIAYAFEELSSGQFNYQLRLIVAVFNYAVKLGYLKSNPALNLEAIHRQKVEVKPLPNEIVRGMLNAATSSEWIELLPYLSLGFFCACREAELSKILWSDVFLAESRLLIRASVSKTKRKRYIEIPPNCLEWLRLYLSQTTVQPEERILRSFTQSQLRDARAANWKAAGGIGPEPQNSKRRTCASCHIALHEDYDRLSLQLGHTSSQMSLQHVGGVTRKEATEYFQIRPE